MKIRAVLLSCFLTLSFCVFSQKPKPTGAKATTAGPKLVQEVTKKGNEIVIPFKKYIMPNGLTVIIHEDHSDPIVYVDVTYHVGSAREQEGRSGFAHFFEHMMFQGSKNVADELHFKYITEAGGTLNGSTNLDRTNYFETVPSNQLETMLWLESDRMGFLLDSVTHAKFEVQRATVKNERGQRYDNAPYGVMGEKTNEVFYPKGHPYSWTTIGYIEDLNRVDENDLKRFYMRWYGPNNAALTIAGDVNTENVLQLVEKYFGSIQKGPEVKKQVVATAKLTKDLYISYEDKVKFPHLKMAWHTVPKNHKDEAALDALGSILSPNNLSSIFYEKLVKNQKAVGVFMYNSSSELAGRFEINVRGLETTPLAEYEKIVKEILLEWEKKGISDDDMQKLKAKEQSQTFEQFNTVQGKGARLAAYQTFTKNPNQIGNDLNKVLTLKKEDLMRVYNTYIKNKFCVIMSVVPNGKKELIAKADNCKKPERTIQTESAEYKNLKFTEPKDNFDRSKKPGHGANPVVHVPEIWKEDFKNGIKLIGSSTNEIPKVNLQINIGAGHRYESTDKAGLATLLSSMLDEASTVHSAEEIETLLDKMGSSVGVNAGDNDITIYVSCLKTNLDATLKIVEEKLFKPKLDEEDFNRNKKELLNGIKSQAMQPVALADNLFNKLTYGKNHIMAIPTFGKAETVEKITLDDLKNYYKTQFSPSVSKIIVVGDITKDELLPKLKFMQDWQNQKVVKTADPELPKIEKTKIYFADKKGAAQSEVRIGAMAMPYDATEEFYKASVMNFIFAGNFNSRINLQLRELRGYTYGTNGSFTGGIFNAPYLINGGIKANATDTAIMDYLFQMKKYVNDGITDEELLFTKSAIGQSEALKYEAPNQKAGFLKRLLDYNLDKEYTHKQNEILATMTKEEINALAKKHLPLNNMNIVIVGDKATLLERIKKLGYEVVEVDFNGEPVK